MKKLLTTMFAMMFGLALMISGGVFLSGCENDKYQEKSSVSVEDGSDNQKIEVEATLPSRNNIYHDAGGGIFEYPRGYQISQMSLSNYGYGFEVNAAGYLESQNKGVNNSYAMVKIAFTAEKASASFSIKYISYGESNFDYAIFGNLDQTLTESYTADSTYYKRTYGEASPDEKIITYSNISSGRHFIYVKFRKDGSGHYNNDSLQLFFEHDFSNNNLNNGTWKFQFKGMKYGTLPTATREGYEFKGWYINDDDNMVPPLSCWTFLGGATYNSSTGEIYLPNQDSQALSPLIYVGDTAIKQHLMYNMSVECMCPTSPTSSTGESMIGGAGYFNANKERYSGNGWARATNGAGVWTLGQQGYGGAEYVGSGDIQYIQMDFSRSSTYANDPYYIRNPKLWISGCDGRKVEENHTVESFSKLYARWEPIKYTVSFDAPNLWENYRKEYYSNGGTEIEFLDDYIDDYGGQRHIVYKVKSVGNDGGPYFYKTRLLAGETYVWSVHIRNRSNRAFTVQLMGCEQGGLKSVNIANDWQLVTHEFVANDNSVQSFVIYGGYQVGDEIDMANLSVQKKSDIKSKNAIQSLKKNYGESYGNLPVDYVKRDNYSFEGFYQKKNYLNSSNMNAMMSYFNSQNSESNKMLYGGNGVYSWTGGTANFSGTDFICYDPKLIVGATYRISYTARSYKDASAETPFYCSLCPASKSSYEYWGSGDLLVNTSGEWDRYSYTFVVPSNYGGFTTVWYSSGRCYFKDITLERVDVDDFEKEITSSSTYNLLSDQILYTKWSPIAITNTVHLRTINKDGSYSDSDDNSGGSAVVSWSATSGTQVNSQSTNQTEKIKTYIAHKAQNFQISATAKTGFAFVGFSTSSTPSDAIKNPTTSPASVTTYNPTIDTDYYVYFKKVSENLLKYDEADKYFYFEDGEYPQGEASNTETLNSSAKANGESFTYCDGKSEVSIPVYTYSNNRYVKVTVRGVTKWFKFEPIRWRISDYGVEKTERNISKYTSLYNFKNYSSYAKNFMAVSDLILGVGAMHNTRKIDENLKDENGVLAGTYSRELTAYQNVMNITNGVSLKVNYSVNTSYIDIDRYGCTEINEGQAVKNSVDDFGWAEPYSAPIRIVSIKELETIGFVSMKARASDMVAFILGVRNDQVSYWTRNLSNLGAGVAISASGTKVRPWLDEVMGVRFAYTFREGSNIIS